MKRYTVRHSTKYEYELPVLHAQHLAHLRPRGSALQVIERCEMSVVPGASSASHGEDYFGNDVDRIEVAMPHNLLEVVATSTVEVKAGKALAELAHSEVLWEAALPGAAVVPMVDGFRFDSPLVRAHQALREYALPTFSTGRRYIDALAEFNQRINEEFSYEPSTTEISTPLAQVLRERRGVCQDFAHVAVGCLRSLGLAARYVSGYLETNPPPGMPRLVGADASHAWASAWVPGLGWVDFDPTNNAFPGTQHITVSWGRDFSDVSPLKGVVLGGGEHRIRVGVDVQPLGQGKATATDPSPPSSTPVLS